MCPLARPTHRVRVGGTGRDYTERIATIHYIVQDCKRRYDLVVFQVKVISITQGDGNSGALYSK